MCQPAGGTVAGQLIQPVVRNKDGLGAAPAKNARAQHQEVYGIPW